MATKSKFQAIRGTRDLLPPETELWNRVEQTARGVFATYGFGEIRPPIFESTDLFARAVGGETDIVSKEMYSFLDNPDISDLELAAQAVKRGSSGAPEIFEIFVDDLIKKIDKRVDSKDITLPPTEASQFAALKAKFCDLQNLSRAPDERTNTERARLTSDIIFQLELMRFAENVSLRPEATAGICRAYIEHNMQQWSQPVKLYALGPMFRRERPQKGRYRQFYQIDAEVLDTVRPEAAKDVEKELKKDAATDAEVIEMVMVFFERLGLEGVQLEINSIGHSAPNCRRGYVEKLKAELQKVKDKLGPDSQRRIETNPLRVLDSKLESEQAVIEKLPRIGEHLCPDCTNHYDEVKRQLDLRGVAYKENWRLVRGLDYYMRTTFEITARGLGSQNAVCGGGRYDGLVELLGGPPTKAIGFAIGEDRLILSLQETGKAEPAKGRDVFIAWMGEKAQAVAIRAAKTLRAEGLSVEVPPAQQKFAKALGQADKLRSRYALILGEDEVTTGQWTLKTLSDGTQTKLTETALLDFLRKTR